MAMLIAKKRNSFVDYFGMVYMSGYGFVLLGLTLTDWIEIDINMRIQLICLLAIYYFICLGLLCSNFLFNLIGRSLAYTVC